MYHALLRAASAIATDPALEDACVRTITAVSYITGGEGDNKHDVTAIEWCMQALFVLANHGYNTCVFVLRDRSLFAAFSLAQARALRSGVACALVQGLGVLLGVGDRMLERSEAVKLLRPCVDASVSELLSAWDVKGDAQDMVCWAGSLGLVGVVEDVLLRVILYDGMFFYERCAFSCHFV